MNTDDMTLDQFMELQRAKTQGKTNIELAFELKISNDARNELYRQLYLCQRELRATEGLYGLYVQKTIDLAQRLGCIPGMDIWSSIEQEFNRLKESKDG